MLFSLATPLPDGPRVRLRLPHASDRVAVAALLGRLGLAAAETDVARGLRFDPRRRAVVLATAWVDGGERIVGLGAIDCGASAPDLLLWDEASAPGGREALASALRARAARAA